MGEKYNDKTFCEEVAFVGEGLGVFFLEDPLKGGAEASFQAIQELDVEESSKEWPFVNDILAEECLEKMKKALVELDKENLGWEYRRLFVGPNVKPAPPWGSVYTDRECVIFGESTLNLRQWMREKGIERQQDENAPEDHIGLMLLLMAWIARNQPQDLEEYLKSHFLMWSSHFLVQLAEASDHPFYEGLALLTKASLEGIQSELSIEISYPKYYR